MAGGVPVTLDAHAPPPNAGPRPSRLRPARGLLERQVPRRWLAGRHVRRTARPRDVGGRDASGDLREAGRERHRRGGDHRRSVRSPQGVAGNGRRERRDLALGRLRRGLDAGEHGAWQRGRWQDVRRRRRRRAVEHASRSLGPGRALRGVRLRRAELVEDDGRRHQLDGRAGRHRVRSPRGLSFREQRVAGSLGPPAPRGVDARGLLAAVRSKLHRRDEGRRAVVAGVERTRRLGGRRRAGPGEGRAVDLVRLEPDGDDRRGDVVVERRARGRRLVRGGVHDPLVRAGGQRQVLPGQSRPGCFAARTARSGSTSPARAAPWS